MKVKDENTTLPINYEGQQYILWFNGDSQNLMNLSGQLFRGGKDLTDPNLVALIEAANIAISEVEKDILKIKEQIDLIVPILPTTETK